ncbi:MAG: creatininase family protein [Candidatus Dormibacteraeota bacterium]|uniref:Creatininase family protein n=1 Tax=Candidatus Dormiibacter inghamiae TaxID=3127013 RepID=A0A934KEI8_9BACT|nr:creatininase family protein [Candidatus Dormibacteraeota bacterium]MBJ7606482.1 creatininase family protein [Candidatus Dormibacteraeota bacterium]
MAWAILPIGAHEQHGAHLPLETDTIVAGALSMAVAARLGGRALPALPYGTSSEHIDFAGTVPLRWATLAAVVTDVVAACWYHHVDPVFVLSGHGGNFILNPTLRELNAHNRPDHQAVLIPESVVFGPAMTETDLHAGRWETSLILHLRPDLVQMGNAVDEVPRNVIRGDLTNRPMQHFTRSGVWGRPTEATPEEGERLFAEMVGRLVGYVGGWVS